VATRFWKTIETFFASKIVEYWNKKKRKKKRKKKESIPDLLAESLRRSSDRFSRRDTRGFSLPFVSGVAVRRNTTP